MFLKGGMYGAGEERMLGERTGTRGERKEILYSPAH